jgi:hypothetical protein
VLSSLLPRERGNKSRQKCWMGFKGGEMRVEFLFENEMLRDDKFVALKE